MAKKKINARQKGHAYERAIVNELKDLGFEDCSTSRYSNRRLDDMKVDIDGMPMFHVQCKAIENMGSAHKVLKEMPEDEKYNVVFHKRNNMGSVVSMSKEDFYEILTILKNENLIK